MSKLNELINELCPNGVEYKPLLSVSDVLYGYPCDASLFNTDYIGKPLVRIRDVLNGTSDTFTTQDVPDKYCLSVGDLLVGMDGNFHVANWKTNGGILCQRVCKIYSNDGELTVLNGFLSHLLKPIIKNIEINKQSGTVKHLLDKDIKSISIPVPPLPVQQEIVRILDIFEDLLVELKNELTVREKQYLNYALKLISFNDNVKYKKIGEVCTVEKGKTPIQKAIAGNYPLVATTEERQTTNSYQFDCQAVCVPLISSRGHGVASISRIYFQEGKFALGNILCAIIPNDYNIISAQFLRYYLFLKKDTKLVPLMRGGANVSLTIDSIKKVEIPLIPISEQHHIVNIFDIFETLCNDMTCGLPAEIAARQKQYEYYRDKLLTFKEVGNESI